MGNTYTRYHLPDVAGREDFWSYVHGALEGGLFKPPEEDQALSAGFASHEDLFDPELTAEDYHLGEYVIFALRVDEKKIPPMTIKKEVAEATRRFEKERTRRPSRAERREILEEVTDRLQKKIPHKPSGCEVIWNTRTGLILVGSMSAKVLDLFLERIERWFSLYPVPLYHVHWALSLDLAESMKDRLSSMVNVKSPSAVEDGRFLGYELLTWLFHFPKMNRRIELAEGLSMEVMPGEAVRLRVPHDQEEEVLCRTRSEAMVEIHSALECGKLIDELELLITIGEDTFELRLDSALQSVKSVRLPRIAPDAEDKEGVFLTRIYLLERALLGLDALYTEFLKARLDPEWKDILTHIRLSIEG